MIYGDKPPIDVVLTHHGIKGQRWGVRRFQNPDGSYTESGKKRYATLNKAAEKADRFAEYARKDAERFEKYADKANSVRRKVRNDPDVDDDELWQTLPTNSDYKRYAAIAKKGEAYYKKVANDLRNKNVAEIDRKELKAIEKWVEKSWYDDAVGSSDYVSNGKRRNRMEDKYDKGDAPFAEKKPGVIQKAKDDWNKSLERRRENLAKNKK